MLGLRGGMLVGKGLDDVASGKLLLGARGARPVDEETLTTNFAANVGHSVGEFAENLHGGIGPFEGLYVLWGVFQQHVEISGGVPG